MLRRALGSLLVSGLLVSGLALPGCGKEKIAKVAVPDAGVQLRYDLTGGQAYGGHLKMRNTVQTPLGDLIQAIETAFFDAGAVSYVRLHGDCHRGNVLWTDAGPHFVDLDDARTGPAVQDFWMLLPGDQEAAAKSLKALVSGYEQFREFRRDEFALIEALRTLRLLHYSAWIGRRWDDPAFPAAFPWFGTQRYWQDRILELREQVAAMQEPPLTC